MKENIKKFLEEVSKSAELRKELKGSNDKEAMIKAAKEHGFELTEADFNSSAMTELSEDEMKAVAGGAVCSCSKKGHGTEEDLSCSCNGAGEGINVTNNGWRCGCFSLLGAGFGLG